jgi:hypothetical protein
MFHPTFQPPHCAKGQLRRPDLDARRARLQHRQADVFVVAGDDLDVLARLAAALGSRR